MIRTLLIAVALWLTVLPTATAQTLVDAVGQVMDVKVEGTRRLEPFVVLSAVDLSRGDTLTSARVRRDLKSVFGTGFFDDVRVESRPVDGGVDLVFIVIEKPAVRQVLLEGHKKIDDEDLREVMDIRPFSVLNEASIARNTLRITDLYVEKGYFLASVTPRIVEVTESQVDLVYDIVENRAGDFLHG
jgi:outer membrane protein insertion porin family